MSILDKTSTRKLPQFVTNNSLTAPKMHLARKWMNYTDRTKTPDPMAYSEQQDELYTNMEARQRPVSSPSET